jgi:hypothetical protein
VFDLAARRQLNRGYGDGLSRALEIVLTPLVFGFLGRLVDGWLGTGPWCMLGFGAFAVSGMFVRFWLGYDREMQVHEARIPKAAASVDVEVDAAAEPVAVPEGKGGT